MNLGVLDSRFPKRLIP